MFIQQVYRKGMGLNFFIIITKYMHTLIIRLVCGRTVKRSGFQVTMMVMKAESVHTTGFSKKPAILSVETGTSHSFVTRPGHFHLVGILFQKMVQFGRSIKTNHGQIQLRSLRL